MGCPGIEPGTNRLKAEYSTIELATLFDLYTTFIILKLERQPYMQFYIAQNISFHAPKKLSFQSKILFFARICKKEILQDILIKSVNKKYSIRFYISSILSDKMVVESILIS